MTDKPVYPEDVELESHAVTWGSGYTVHLHAPVGNPERWMSCSEEEARRIFATHQRCLRCGSEALNARSLMCADCQDACALKRWYDRAQGRLRDFAGVIIAGCPNEVPAETHRELAHALLDEGLTIEQARPLLVEWTHPKLDAWDILEDHDAPEGIEPSSTVEEAVKDLNEALATDCQWWKESALRPSNEDLEIVRQILIELSENAPTP